MNDARDVLPVRVSRRWTEAVDIVAFEFVACDGRPLPAFSAGSHIDVHIKTGMVRQYSLCNDPSEEHRYQIAVLKDPGSRGGSVHMHEQIHEGLELIISAPRNHFELAHGSRQNLLIAGGIGVTPILCMAERLFAIGARFDMHYCTRSPERTAFHNRLAQSQFSERVHYHHDEGAQSKRLDIRSLLRDRDRQEHLYVCGPKGFIDAVLTAARSQGWAEARLHYEFFGALPSHTAGDRAFQVQLASSGRLVHVDKEESVVQALARAGIDVRVSCEQGVCGTCITRVLEGVPEHRDCYFTPDEQAANDQFTPCCSRAKSPRLVLDL